MKRMLLLFLFTLVSALLLTGCASSADTLPSPTPGATNMLDNLMPDMAATTANPTAGASAQPDASAGPAANGERTLEDTQKASQAMEEAVEKLSEVDDAYVVTVGDTALVGLKFTSQYKGEMDDRLIFVPLDDDSYCISCVAAWRSSLLTRQSASSRLISCSMP